MLIILIIKSILTLEACELQSGNNLTLTKFYSDNCDHCTKIAPHFNEIKDKIVENNLNMKINNVNCQTCDCSALDITAIPTMILSKGKEEIARHRGYTEYNGIVKFLTDNLEISEKVFDKSIKNTGKVIQLYERDFYSGFKGPWMILFYSKKKDKLRGIFNDLAINYYDRLNIGEISESNSVNLIHRFNIQSFPAIITIYNGILAGYNGKQNIEDLSKFVDKLIKPSFSELTLKKFDKLIEDEPKVPKFVVFYNNLGLANSFYRKAAHEYKLRTEIYKTSDYEMFQRASIYPKKINEEGTDDEKVILTVYKDNVFHKCPVSLSDPHEIAQWLFHSHFPHVTKITNDNFYTIFHGLKPAVILLTQNDEYVDLLEQSGEKLNDGLPFNEQVLGVLDVSEFSMFLPSLLPGFKSPGIIVYDPRRQLFFTKKVSFNEKNFHTDLLSLINDYFADRLRPYPDRSSWKKYLIVGALIGCVVIALISRRKRNTLRKKE